MSPEPETPFSQLSVSRTTGSERFFLFFGWVFSGNIIGAAMYHVGRTGQTMCLNDNLASSHRYPGLCGKQPSANLYVLSILMMIAY